MMRTLVLLSLILLPLRCLYAQDGVEKFKPTIIARVIIDGAVFLSQGDTLNSGANFTDARIGVKGKYEDWYYKLDVGFVNKTASLKDVLFGYRLGHHQFQIGQIYEPFSMDLLTSSVDMKFPQATGAATAFGAYRKLNVSYTYDIKKWNFTFGVFSDKSGNDLEQESKAYSFHTRLIYRPIYTDNKLLHLALAPSWKKTDDEVVFSSPGNSIIDTKPMTYVKLQGADSQVRLGTEAHFGINKFTIQGEYMFLNVLGDGYSYFAQGGYMEVTFIPYGERYNYDTSWGCLGRPSVRSLELAARYNYLNMDDYSENILGGEYQDFSIGANYYVNRHFAFKLNYSCLFPMNNIKSIDDDPLSLIQFRVQFVL